MKKIFVALPLVLFACNLDKRSGSMGTGESKQAELPKINVKLPPSPSFQKEHPPEVYPDASQSVYGLRKNIETMLNKEVRVKGFLTELYQCPKCPRGKKDCTPCLQEHFYLSDRADGPKEKALMVTDYPKRDPETRKKLKFVVGAKYYVTGTFAQRSTTGFAQSNGLLVFTKSEPVVDAE